MFLNHQRILICTICIMALQAVLFASDSGDAQAIKPKKPDIKAGPQIEFEVSVEEKGDYYISFAMYGMFDDKYDVLIDGRRNGFLHINTDGLQNVFLQKTDYGLDAETIRLKKGSHTITIPGNKDWEIPNILNIKIGKDYEKAVFSFPKPSAPAKTLLKNERNTSDAMNATGFVPDPGSPYYEFSAVENLYFTPDYYSWITLNAGDEFVLWAVLTNGTIPQINLFECSDPVNNGSWSNRNSGNSIIGTATKTAVYMVLVTAPAGIGYCYNLHFIKNGTHSTLKKDFWVLPAAKFDITNKPPFAGNQFFTRTTSAGGDPIMFLFDENHRVVAWNDDGSDSELWGLNSHCGYSGNASYIGVISYSNLGVGYTDIYAYVKNDPEDGIMVSSSQLTQTYNCFAWSGGIGGRTNQDGSPNTDLAYFYPLSITEYWTGINSNIEAFDRFYGNKGWVVGSGLVDYPRFPGAMTFIRCAEDDPKAVIDLYSPDGIWFEHATVNRGANYQMHGYAWESKVQIYSRIFHPRDKSLGYGPRFCSYKPKPANTSSAALSTQKTDNESISGITEQSAVEFASTPKMKAMGINHPLSFDESVALGLTVVRNTTFTENENTEIEMLVSSISGKIRNEYYTKLSSWKKTWKDSKIFNQPDLQRNDKSLEHTQLKEFYNKHGEKIWPLIFKMIKENEPDKHIILKDALSNSPLAQSIMSDVDEELAGVRYTRDGAFIFTTNNDRYRLFCKKMLRSM